MNLNNNEQEIPEIQLEEYALKLDAKDFASRSKKGQSKTKKKRTCRLFHKNNTYGQRRKWIDIEPGKYSLSEYEVEQHSSHLWKIGACLLQLFNLRNENLLSTPVRHCI